jgi:hypothetical protein
LNTLHALASNSRDVEDRLLTFYGVGPVTVNIFLRELRPFWKKANPPPLPIVVELSSRYQIPLDSIERKSVAFARVEAGLIRVRKRISPEGRQTRGPSASS